MTQRFYLFLQVFFLIPRIALYLKNSLSTEASPESQHGLLCVAEHGSADSFVAGLSSIVAASSRADGETQAPVTFKRPTHLNCGSALAINLPNVES